MAFSFKVTVFILFVLITVDNSVRTFFREEYGDYAANRWAIFSWLMQIGGFASLLFYELD